jgi:hypothetical protein
MMRYKFNQILTFNVFASIALNSVINVTLFIIGLGAKLIFRQSQFIKLLGCQMGDTFSLILLYLYFLTFESPWTAFSSSLSSVIANNFFIITFAKVKAFMVRYNGRNGERLNNITRDPEVNPNKLCFSDFCC